ncbi:cerebellin-related [Holotrichia oblita]|uniref:Cerebellin-related n=1 Tax=Holotrichia oblita TaxID=644536 RepID=A0ACB9TDB9_HOLOL|nr:cerebellin-related [Holotrichia oblita]
MALKNIKVIELAGLAPAPFCGMVLADFGASVLRVDKVGANTDLDVLSHGKKSIALNLKHPKGVNILRQLCNKSDVLIEPFRYGVMETLGLGPANLLADNPKLIYARLTGFGQKGFYSKRAGHDINYVALSGLLSLFGRSKEKPTFPVNYTADFGGGGLMCAFGIVMALYERSVSGLGQVVDANMVEGTAYVGSWLYKSQRLPIWGNKRGENVLDSGAHFYEVYETKDGKYMSVGALEPQFYKELLKELGLTDDEMPQYGNFDECKKLLASIFITKTQDEWCKRFDHLDACTFPVLSLDEAPTHQHNKEQEMFVKDSVSQTYVPKPAPNLSRTPAKSVSTIRPPLRGEHTESILYDLQYTAQDIDTLECEGIIERHKNSKL